MSEWVSVVEKLPEQDGRYLVHGRYDSHSSWVRVSAFRNKKFDDQNITHWLLLPYDASVLLKEIGLE